MKPLLIFDYDGTLHQTMKLYRPAIFQICRRLQVPAPDNMAIRSWLGMSIEDMWNDFQPSMDEETKREYAIDVGDWMHDHIADAVWYANIPVILDKLKKEGYPMIVLSNCDHRYAQDHWQHFYMNRWFDCFLDTDSFGLSKSDIIAQVKSDRPAICIGDRKTDRLAATRNGVPFIGCTYGYGSITELQGSAYLIQSPNQLLQKIRSLT